MKNADLDAVIPATFAPPYPVFFADSGAFSAFTRGVSIDVDEYARWLLRYKHWFGVYANLDVIRDAQGTWRNQNILEDRYGLAALPVFHVAEEWSWYERYLERYPYIALGVAGRRASEYMGWLVRCFRDAGYGEGVPRAALHGFGITDWRAMWQLPWYSVDSSTWHAGTRYGAIPVFAKGDLRQTRPDRPHLWYRYAASIRAHGFDPAAFVNRANQDREAMLALAVRAFEDAVAWCRSLHGPIAIPGKSDAEPGLHLYFADSSMKSISGALAKLRTVKVVI